VKSYELSLDCALRRAFNFSFSFFLLSQSKGDQMSRVNRHNEKTFHGASAPKRATLNFQ
jgi:hypothetical protein